MMRWPQVMEYRKDISRFMVHLTRDDRGTDENGATARDNFLNILASRTIGAYRPHCLHTKRLPDAHRSKFKVACFTECPLSQIEHMAGSIPGRQISLEPWGFVFHREFLIEMNAQPVTYINSYGSDQSVRDAYDAIFESSLKMDFAGSKWKVLPFVSAMHDGCDFAWEREWRRRGSLSFEISDIVCAVVPDDVDLEVKKKLAASAIPMYSPGWNLERMIEESGRQQRRVQRLASPKHARQASGKADNSSGMTR
jgi:hypothetical protein